MSVLRQGTNSATNNTRSLPWLVLGVAIGITVMVIAPRIGSRPGHVMPVGDVATVAKVWTCSMHPQIRMNRPGRCPICGMELVPIEITGAPGTEQDHSAAHIRLSEHARRMARVETAAVEERELFKDIRTIGRVDLDETRVAHIAARVDGRVDEVFANFPGTPVKEGDHVVKIYSPSLVSGQQEFLLTHQREQELRKAGTGPSLSAATRERLSRLGMTDEQLDELARTGKAQNHVVVYTPISGTVIEKKIRAGQYVKEGDSLYIVADLTHVWLILEIYESDLSWVRFGQSVEVTLESEPDVKFTGTVGFVEPLLNESTRTVRVRVILKNDAGKLKPGMYAQALIRVPIMPDGKPAPTGLEGKYACPMHPYVVSETEGKCSVCKMPLELVPGEPDEDLPKDPPMVLAMPAEAVLTTGRRRLVFVELRPGEYHMVEPTLGPRTGDFFPVLKGLESGQRVVVRGNFLLDSQFQITGKPSLLYPEGISGGGTDHAGHAMPEATPDSAPESSRAGQPGHDEHGKATNPTDASSQAMANLAKLSVQDHQLALAQRVCPISSEPLGEMGVPVKVTVQNRFIFLCCNGCEPKFRNDPDAVLRKLSAKPGHDGH